MSSYSADGKLTAMISFTYLEDAIITPFLRLKTFGQNFDNVFQILLQTFRVAWRSDLGLSE